MDTEARPHTAEVVPGATNGVNGNHKRPTRQDSASGLSSKGEDKHPEDSREYEGEEDGAGDGSDVFEDDEDGDVGGDAKSGVVRNTLSSIDWDESFVDPLTVHFTQEKIHPFFHRRGPINHVLPKIRAVLRLRPGEEEKIELLPPFPPIHCLRNGEELWTLDNRRLYALQQVAMEHWPQRCFVRVLCRDSLPKQRFRTQYRKFNTTSDGRGIKVCARYQQFDTWSWFDRAVEYEWFFFSQRLGWLLSVFEILPVAGVLLFRTGLTGFSSRFPLVMGFILTFTCDFLRQRVPVVEKRLCELHVQAVMDGEVRPLCPCWRRWNNAAQRKMSGCDENQIGGPMSTPQLAAFVALALVLVLPYVLGIAGGQLRSSLLSCWLGIACVLAVQLGGALSRGAAALPKLSPKSTSGAPAMGRSISEESTGGGGSDD